MNQRIERLLEDLKNAVYMFNKSAISYCDILLSLEEVEDESIGERVNEIIKDMPPADELVELINKYGEKKE